VSVSTRFYGTESNEIQAAEIKCSRNVKGCSRLGQIKMQNIRKELNTYSVIRKMEHYRKNGRPTCREEPG
jgi:hypothetical protein